MRLPFLPAMLTQLLVALLTFTMELICPLVTQLSRLPRYIHPPRVAIPAHLLVSAHPQHIWTQRPDLVYFHRRLQQVVDCSLKSCCQNCEMLLHNLPGYLPLLGQSRYRLG